MVQYIIKVSAWKKTLRITGLKKTLMEQEVRKIDVADKAKG